MNINQVISEGNKYIKLQVNESIMVRFTDNFEKSEGESNGRKFVTYNCECSIRQDGDTVTKVWGGSANFYERVQKKAVDANMSFTDCNFKITKQLVDGKTNWDIVVMNNGSNVVG